MKLCAYLLIVFCFACDTALAQGDVEKSIDWIDFEQLDVTLSRKRNNDTDSKEKRILIYFYADWCAYCKKMEDVAFEDLKVVRILNQEYHAVKMNAESEEFISFDGQVFYNEEIGKKRNPTHQLALLLASRKDHSFTLPALVILDKDFKVVQRYFEYLTAEQLVEFLAG